MCPRGARPSHDLMTPGAMQARRPVHCGCTRADAGLGRGPQGAPAGVRTMTSLYPAGPPSSVRMSASRLEAAASVLSAAVDSAQCSAASIVVTRCRVRYSPPPPRGWVPTHAADLDCTPGIYAEGKQSCLPVASATEAFRRLPLILQLMSAPTRRFCLPPLPSHSPHAR